MKDVAQRADDMAGRASGRLASMALHVVGMMFTVVAAIIVVTADGIDRLIPAAIAMLVAVGCFYAARRVRADRSSLSDRL